MENATKALLIAAAVLIAIVLVALGVNLLGSTGDMAENAGAVSDKIHSSTNSAVSSLSTTLGGLTGGADHETITIKITTGSIKTITGEPTILEYTVQKRNNMESIRRDYKWCYINKRE